MAHASLTRRVKFTARHRFWNAGRSAAENEKLFGGAASSQYHGHDYYCDVTLSGKLDPRSGMIVDLARFDEILRAEVRDRFDGKSINDDVPEFGDGKLAPSGENLANFIFDRVSAALSGGAEVTEVVVAEDDTLRATYRGK
jgi:6-pyruvoyltetrahydropterin/6-carboxytetrahydropterin synthase